MSPRKNRGVRKRGQPSPRVSPEPKKQRRSERLNGRRSGDEPSTPKDRKPSGGADLAATMSPPGHNDHQALMSSPLQETQSTQIATQIFSQDAKDEDSEDGVWGYLDPINDPSPTRGVIKLNKQDGDDSQEHRSADAKSTKNVSGYLIGRHPECDLTIDSGVISNRHCVIYKEHSGLAAKVILEDLSSNGTWINGVIIGRNKYREMEHGDEITLAGDFRYHFRFPTTSISTGFKDNFTLGPLLGSGHFANVFLAIEKKSGKQFAVKVFKKKQGSQASTQDLQQEIAVLMSVGHPNILCLKFPYDEPDGVYLVLELAPEGELFNYILQRQKIPEHDTRKIIIQLLNGLKYLHERNIVHRDIKPENILLADKNLHVKLGDFGLAKIVGEDSFTTSLCGTPSYVAPEILRPSKNRRYDRAVDVWSLGVVMYICLCGFPPFSDELVSKEFPYTLSEQIKKGLFDFPSPYWDSISDEALDLIDSMMQVDSRRRITVQDALKHPWIKGGGAGPADSCSSLADGLERLQFAHRRVKRERTLLAKAPGLVNPNLENPSKYQVKIQQDKPRDNLDAQTAAFVAMGGKGGDEALFSDGGDSYYVVSQGGEGGED